MSQALYRKWRPRRWEEVVGQEHIVQTLRNSVAAGRLAHAFLFAGPRGTGKTTTARLLAKAVNCLDEDPAARPCDQCEHCQAVNAGRFLDLIEIDAASNTSVEDVRDLRDKINFSPNQGRFKVYIIDEVHMLSTAAFNALLKTLEEPPAHAIFILATTEVHKIPATVLSRCQRHEFRRIPVLEIVRYLKEMVVGEGIQVEEDALTLIARQSTGCLRDAISLLDQLASSGKTITLAAAETVLGTAASRTVAELVDDLARGDPAGGLEHIHKALDAGNDPRQLARQVVEYLRDLLLIKMGNPQQVEVSQDMRSAMAAHAQKLALPRLLEAIRSFNQAAAEGRSSWQSSLPLEMALIEALNLETSGVEPVSREMAAVEPAPGVRAVTEKAGEHPVEKKKTADRKAAEKPSSEAQPTPGMDPESQALFGKVKEHWRQIMDEIRQVDPYLQAVINSCEVLAIEQGTLLLEFNGDYAYRAYETGESRAIVGRIIAKVIGQEIAVQGVLRGARKKLPPGVDRNGLVASAVNDLGGEIVDTQ